MVYCGKPSKGCQACRDRKTRCDRQTPSCSQCIRASRQCPGYRNQLDLMFRNESEAVIVRAKGKKQPKAKLSTASSPASSTYVSVSEGSSQPSPVPNDYGLVQFSHRQLEYHRACITTTMAPTISERAQGFFNKTSAMWLSNFDLIDSLCSQSHTDEHLLASMSAVGLASLSTSVHAPELMHRARRDYVTALRLTNAALRSPTEVKKDSTLFSVLILTIFETVSGSNEKSFAAWTEHVNGAAALVKLRGPEQFKTVAGQRMFLQIISNLMVSCVQRTTEMPSHMIELRKFARELMDPQNPAWKLTGVIIDFTNFRAKVKDFAIVGARNIVDMALNLDCQFIQIISEAPESWAYRTVFTDDRPDMVWDGQYHIYEDFWVSQLYNGMRTFRILLHEIVRDQIHAASTASAPIFTDEEVRIQLESSADILLEMQAGILRSVPQHMPWSINKKPQSLLEGSRAYFVLWPLYLVGVMDLASEEVRAWVKNQLRSIGEEIGIKHATVLADFMERRQMIENWDNSKDYPRLQAVDQMDERLYLQTTANGTIITA